MGYVEMIGALSAGGAAVPRLELLLGWHPEREGWMTEQEERAWEDLHYLAPSAIEGADQPHPWVAALKLWIRYFPELQAQRGRRITFDDLWVFALRDVRVLKLGYAFYPVLRRDPNRPWEDRNVVRQRAREIQQEIERGIETDHRAKGKVTWTLPFPANGPLGRQIEARSGLSVELRKGVGLEGVVPGLLQNYMYENAADLADMVSPHGFEELVGRVYESDGWEVVLTRKVKDGGKDAVATKEVDGRFVVAYIEAKRYRNDRAVGLSQVKEFAATVAGDQVDRGILVSTSRFSKAATEWMDGAGARVAAVDLVDLPQFRSFLGDMIAEEVGAYLFR